MAGRWLILLDPGDSTADKSLSYLRRGVGEKEAGKRIAVYIGGGKEKIIVDTGAPDPEQAFREGCLLLSKYGRDAKLIAGA